MTRQRKSKTEMEGDIIDRSRDPTSGVTREKELVDFKKLEIFHN